MVPIDCMSLPNNILQHILTGLIQAADQASPLGKACFCSAACVRPSCGVYQLHEPAHSQSMFQPIFKGLIETAHQASIAE